MWKDDVFEGLMEHINVLRRTSKNIKSIDYIYKGRAGGGSKLRINKNEADDTSFLKMIYHELYCQLKFLQ